MLTSHGINLRDLLNLVAEERNPDRCLLVGRMYLERVAPHPEPAPPQHHVVALVLHVDQASQRSPLVQPCAPLQHQQLAFVVLGRSQAVDARDGCHHDGVTAGQQCRRGRVAEPVDLVVHRRVLLDEGVAGRQVCLGLVVVVVGDEVLDTVAGEELPQLVGELRG